MSFLADIFAAIKDYKSYPVPVRIVILVALAAGCIAALHFQPPLWGGMIPVIAVALLALVAVAFLIPPALWTFNQWDARRRARSAIRRHESLELKPRNISFEFFHLVLTRKGVSDHEIILVGFCSNLTSDAVQLGVLELNVQGTDGAWIFDNPIVLDAAVETVPPIELVPGRNRLGRHVNWKKWVGEADAKRVMDAVNHLGANFYVEVKVYLAEPIKAWWPDTSSHVNPKEGWRGQLRVVDHSQLVTYLEKFMTATNILERLVGVFSHQVSALLNIQVIQPKGAQDIALQLASLNALYEAMKDDCKVMPGSEHIGKKVQTDQSSKGPPQ